jgi:hypothetical protein
MRHRPALPIEQVHERLVHIDLLRYGAQRRTAGAISQQVSNRTAIPGCTGDV